MVMNRSHLKSGGERGTGILVVYLFMVSSDPQIPDDDDISRHRETPASSLVEKQLRTLNLLHSAPCISLVLVLIAEA